MEVRAADALSNDVPVGSAGDQGHAVLVHDVLELLSDLTHLRGVVQERGGGDGEGGRGSSTVESFELADFKRGKLEHIPKKFVVATGDISPFTYTHTFLRALM